MKNDYLRIRMSKRRMVIASLICNNQRYDNDSRYWRPHWLVRNSRDRQFVRHPTFSLNDV